MLDPKIVTRLYVAKSKQKELIKEIKASEFRPDDKLEELDKIETAICQLEFDISRGIYGQR